MNGSGFSHFAGLRIITNDQKVLAPVRALAPKSWHKRGGYAKRVGKKWRKRFGFHLAPLIPPGTVYVMNAAGAVAMNAGTLRSLRLAIDRNDFAAIRGFGL